MHLDFLANVMNKEKKKDKRMFLGREEVDRETKKERN